MTLPVAFLRTLYRVYTFPSPVGIQRCMVAVSIVAGECGLPMPRRTEDDRVRMEGNPEIALYARKSAVYDGRPPWIRKGCEFDTKAGETIHHHLWDRRPSLRRLSPPNHTAPHISGLVCMAPILLS